MRLIVFLLAIVLVSCKSEVDVFDETQYTLIRSDSLDGIVGSQVYTFKHDTLRKMILEHDAKGKLMGKMFTYKEKLDGNQTFYDIDGKTILVVDSFSNGQKVVSRNFSKQTNSVKFYKDGKEVDSISLIR